MSSFQTAFSELKGLGFPVGMGVDGQVVTADLSKLHHLFIAGATGSGKSVFLDSFLLTVLAHNTPEQLRLVLCDTKLLGFSRHGKVSHLLLPICTAIETIFAALDYVHGECQHRLELLSITQCRQVGSYNDQVWEAFLPELPQIVLVLDDISMIFSARPEAEGIVADLLSKGRTVGIHLVAATQTPSVKKVKQLLSLFPARLVLPLTSLSEFWTISQQKKLPPPTAPGDALFCSGSTCQVVRTWMLEEKFADEVLDTLPTEKRFDSAFFELLDPHRAKKEEVEELLPAAIQAVVAEGSASTSLLQRRLKVGYSTAAALLDELEHRGIIGPFCGGRPRSILISPASLRRNTSQKI